jgi:hypothetical protein
LVRRDALNVACVRGRVGVVLAVVLTVVLAVVLAVLGSAETPAHVDTVNDKDRAEETETRIVVTVACAVAIVKCLDISGRQTNTSRDGGYEPFGTRAPESPQRGVADSAVRQHDGFA